MSSILQSIRQIVGAIAFLLSEQNIQIRSGVLTTRRSRKQKRYLKPVFNYKFPYGIDLIEVFPEDGDDSFRGAFTI